MTELLEMRQRVQTVAVAAYEERLVAGTSGNVSEYDHQRRVMAITPTNMDYRVMRPEDVVLMRTDGTIVDGAHRPSSEWMMHAEVYKHRCDINSVMHTHSPRATAFAVLRQRIPLILVEMLPFLGGDIPLADFRLPATPELGMAALEVLVNRNACLLTNHGVLAVGASTQQAHIRAVYVEDAATIYHFARSLGEPYMVPADAEATLRERYGLSGEAT